MEVGYQQMKKGGNRKEAIERLTELIKVSPQNEEYYLDIINLHLQEGNREAALGWSSNGLAAIPGSGASSSKGQVSSVNWRVIRKHWHLYASK